MEQPIYTVLIEYRPGKHRVSVRGVFSRPAKKLPKLEEDNQQNYVDCILEVDHKSAVGFTKLVPEDDLATAQAEIARLKQACQETRSALMDSFGMLGGGEKLNKVFEILNRALQYD